jgi:hypothetical protein
VTIIAIAILFHLLTIRPLRSPALFDIETSTWPLTTDPTRHHTDLSLDYIAVS